MKFKSFISGNSFETELFTDHKPIVGLFKKEASIDHYKHFIKLDSFNMQKIVVKYDYEEGKRNVIADALSKIPVIENNPNNYVSLTVISFMDNYIDLKIIKVDNINYFVDRYNMRKYIEDKDTKADLLQKSK